MSNTRIDLGRSTGLVTPGIHTVKLIRVNETQGPKGPMWNYTAKVVENSEDNGKEFRLGVSLAEGARWRVDLFLDAVGAPPKGTASSEMFLGRTLRVETKNGVWEGKSRTEAVAYLAKSSEEDAPQEFSLDDALGLLDPEADEVGDNPAGPEFSDLEEEEGESALPKDIVEDADSEPPKFGSADGEEVPF